jgi:hypothetical protein
MSPGEFDFLVTMPLNDEYYGQWWNRRDSSQGATGRQPSASFSTIGFSHNLEDHPGMRIITTIVQLALTALLAACDQQESTPDIDPGLGRECFESQRASLPPGTQYEGIDQVAGKQLTIKIMNGIDVTTIDCALNPDGSLQGNDE